MPDLDRSIIMVENKDNTMKILILIMLLALGSCAKTPTQQTNSGIPAPKNIGKCLGLCEKPEDCDGKDYKILTKEDCSNEGGLFKVTN